MKDLYDATGENDAENDVIRKEVDRSTELDMDAWEIYYALNDKIDTVMGEDENDTEGCKENAK